VAGVLLISAALLGGCGAAHGHRIATAHPRTGAEPAVSPAPSRTPAGRQVAVGTHPEGIVADPALGLVVLATRDPAALTVLSAASGRVLRRIATGGAVRHLGLQTSTVLVPDAPENQLLRVNPRTGSLRRTTVGSEPHDATAAAGQIFVADEFGRGISVIEPDGTVRTVPGFVQPGGVAASGHDVAVVDVGADTVTLLDAHTLTRLGTAPAGAGPTHVAADHGDLFVVDTRGDALLEYATTAPTPGIARLALRQIARVPLPGTPYGIAVDPIRNRVWVTLTATDTVVELSANPLHPGVITRYRTGRQPNTVAVDPRTGEVYVADAASGTVQLIDPNR
jgi:DNA-binding beta-propeller fold protein YncE